MAGQGIISQITGWSAFVSEDAIDSPFSQAREEAGTSTVPAHRKVLERNYRSERHTTQNFSKPGRAKRDEGLLRRDGWAGVVQPIENHDQLIGVGTLIPVSTDG